VTSSNPSHSDRECDVAIIGAGPSGAVAAKLLRDNGVSVIILEGSEFPRFSIGESLLPNCLNILEKADLLRPVTEAGFQHKNGATFERGHERRHIDFRENFDEGWGTAFQVQRAEFDKILADGATQSGAEILYGRFVVDAELNKGHCVLTHKGKDGDVATVHSKFVVDASGYGRVLPRLLDLETPSGLANRSSLFTHVKDNINPDHIDRNKILITVHPERKDVWYWLIPFSNGTSSVGVVYSETDEKLDDDQLFERLLGETRMGEILGSSERIRPLNKLNGYSCNVSRLHGSGYVLLGNAAEFLDPVFSSGVTIALKSAELAVPQILKELAGDPTEWDREFAIPLKKGVDVFRVFVNSWYEGGLQDIVLRFPESDSELPLMMVSILSGYAWNDKSTLVNHPKRILRVLEDICV